MERLTLISEGKPFFRLLVASKREAVLVLVLFHDGPVCVDKHRQHGGSAIVRETRAEEQVIQRTLYAANSSRTTSLNSVASACPDAAFLSVSLISV